MIGTASFNAVGGSISNLIFDGVITSIDYCNNGSYTVNLSGQPVENYVVSVSLGGSGADDVWNHNTPLKGKTATAFGLEVRFKGALSDDSDNVQVAVMRLSQ